MPITVTMRRLGLGEGVEDPHCNQPGLARAILVGTVFQSHRNFAQLRSEEGPHPLAQPLLLVEAALVRTDRGQSCRWDPWPFCVLFSGVFVQKSRDPGWWLKLAAPV